MPILGLGSNSSLPTQHIMEPLHDPFLNTHGSREYIGNLLPSVPRWTVIWIISKYIAMIANAFAIDKTFVSITAESNNSSIFTQGRFRQHTYILCQQGYRSAFPTYTPIWLV